MAFLPMERIPISAELRLKPEAADVVHTPYFWASLSGATHSAAGRFRRRVSTVRRA
jgi:hypothetical protein